MLSSSDSAHSIQTAKDSISPSHRFSVAPMIDWTDRHCRYFHRQLSQHARLYTEMVTTGAILHGDRERHLSKHSTEAPVALQLGGSNPEDIATSCTIANDYGYQEHNLNIGCPSDRVQSGRFGACLMKDAELVQDCIQAMQSSSDCDVTVKCRTGVDDFDSFEFLENFISKVADTGCKTVIIHARKAWLSGLSPKENREIPPLHYDRVHRIKSLFPQLNIVINGGITSIEQSIEQLDQVDGVMLGRAAYNDPWLLSQVDHLLFPDAPDQIRLTCRHQAIEKMLPYIADELSQGQRLHHMTRHMLGLFNGLQGAKQYRRYLSENANKPGATENILIEASRFVTSDC